ncbi:hypothetical protein FRC07_008612 [Ceratobasidium sp. 392]|nr:hypothetical protein FRC07_008612 [Ceratobasidium sp. 392]
MTEQERGQQYVSIGADVEMIDQRADNASVTQRLRTYHADGNATPTCTVWQAVRATIAAPNLFKPVLIERNGVNMRYIGGSLRCNNPSQEILAEAAACFPGRYVACVLSIGAGKRKNIIIPKVGKMPKLQLLNVIGTLQDVAVDCESTHQELKIRFTSNPDTYFRFNVDFGTEGLDSEEWQSLGTVQENTAQYIERVNKKMARSAIAILNRSRAGLVTTERAAGR